MRAIERSDENDARRFAAGARGVPRGERAGASKTHRLRRLSEFTRVFGPTRDTGRPGGKSRRTSTAGNLISNRVVRHGSTLERIRNLLARSPGHTSRDAAHRDALERVSRVFAPRARRANQRAFEKHSGLALCRPRFSCFFSGIASAFLSQLCELRRSRGGRATRTKLERRTRAPRDVDGGRG